MSFRSFGWLLIRRAYLQLIDDNPDSPEHWYIRRTIAQQRTYQMHVLGATFLAHNPHRRWRG